MEKDLKKIISEEVVNDYYTAGIKAEVILDMLLRPVIENVLGGLGYPSIKFITKEFPIPTKANDEKANDEKANDNHNCNVDYLMHDDNNVYLVELKTNNTSKNKDQLENYIDQFSNNKTEFGDVFGQRFIWMLNHCSASGIGKGKGFDENEWSELKSKLGNGHDVECLKKLFNKIISFKNNISYDEITKYSQKAIKYLKKSKRTGSAKYIFQAGQILDSLDSNSKSWWDKDVQLIYIVPDVHIIDGEKEKILEEKDKTEYSDYIKVISIEDIKKELESPNNSDSQNESDLKKQYDTMLISILNDIFGSEGEIENDDN